MKKLLLGILLSLSLASPVLAFDSSLTLNQTNPVFGQDITYTAIYPTEAAQTPKRSQQHYNPQVQTDCYQFGVLVMSTQTVMDTKQKLTGGWKSITYSLNLSAGPRNELPGWTSGGATCGANLYSYQDGVLTIWAHTDFEVAP